MNIGRFSLPAIIAAGLHGALFLGLTGKAPNETVPPDIAKVIGLTPVFNEPVVVDLEPVDEGSKDNGSVTPCPSVPDIEKPFSERESFTVPVESFVPVISSLATCPPTRDAILGLGHPGMPGRTGIPRAASLDRVPRAVVQPSPDYPAALHTDSVDGAVTVEFLVDTTGSVLTAEAVNWTRREFVDPAVRAVLRWRFAPGTIGGKKVRFRMAVPIEFINARR